MVYNAHVKNKRATAQINKPTAGGISDEKEKTMRYKNYILSKGDKVKLKPYSDDWLPSMTKNYGGKVVTIKDFIYNFGFVCEPLGDDVASYMFDVNDIDEVVYRKNNEDKIKKYEIKKGLECCAAVGSEASCSDCSYCYRCSALYKDALNIITEQEKEIDALKEKCEELRNEKWDAQDDLDCYYDEMLNKIKQAKIKAVKDFAEKLKARITRVIGRHDLSVRYFNEIVSDLLKRSEE